MTAVAKELVEIAGKLTEDKAREVVDFARFPQQQDGDHEWERILSDTRPRPKLDAFLAEAMREEPSEPLDPNKL